MTEQPRSIHDRIMQARHTTGDGRDGFAVDPAMSHTRATSPRLWQRPLIYGIAAAALLGGVGLGVWQFPVLAENITQAAGKKPVQPSTAQPASQAQPQSSTNAPAQPNAASDPFQTHAEQAGAKTCTATYAALGKMLTDGTQFMVQTQTAKAEVDQHALQGVVGITFPPSKDGNFTGPAAGLVFAAPTAQGCEGTMVRVVPFPQNCQAAVNLLPKGSQQLQPLSGLPVFALASGGQAMLMPAGNGCVVLSIMRAGG